MINIAIIDDQLEDLKKLEENLLRFSEENQQPFNIVCYQDPLTFFDEYKKADIIFMDVDMPHLNGIEAARKLRKIDEKVALIFVTNMAQYAIKGYEVNARDYVLKPIRYNRFSALIKKTLLFVQKNQDVEVWLKTANGDEKFYASEIIYVEVRNHLLIYHTLKGEIEVWSSLKEAAQKLPENFLRCSNNIIVNCNYITLSGKDFIELNNGLVRLDVPRSRRKEFLENLNHYLGLQ